MASLPDEKQDSTDQLLVTSVGKPSRGYQQLTYRLGDVGEPRTHTTKFAPAALARLLHVRGGALILRTEESRPYADELQRELEGLGIGVTQVKIAAEPVSDLLTQVFEALEDRYSHFGELLLDFTHGFRHLPLVYSAVLSFLSALQQSTRYRIYYAMAEARDSGGLVPIVDLTDSHWLIQWHYAAASARISGDLRPLARLHQDDVSSLFQKGERPLDLSMLKDASKELATSLALGLPIEAGISAGRLIRALNSLEHGSATPAAWAARSLRHEFEPWALSDQAEKMGVRWSREELERQRALASYWCEKGDLQATLLLLREILVSLFLRPEDRDHWLDLSVRQRAERVLNSLAERAKLGVADDGATRVDAIWQRVSCARNEIAHSGMRVEEVRFEQEKARRLVEEVKELLEGGGGAVQREGEGRTLLSPFGLSPGVLLTALWHAERHAGRVDHLMVVTSAEAKDRVPEAVEKAGKAGLPVTILVMNEPHTGYEEARGMLGQASAHAERTVRELLAWSDEVVVNIVGGTTAMQVIVEQLTAEARKLGVRTRRIAVIDRRPPEEQRAAPYAFGEAVWLDEGEISAVED